jgi:hypothetical protein
VLAASSFADTLLLPPPWLRSKLLQQQLVLLLPGC